MTIKKIGLVGFFCFFISNASHSVIFQDTPYDIYTDGFPWINRDFLKTTIKDVKNFDCIMKKFGVTGIRTCDQSQADQ